MPFRRLVVFTATFPFGIKSETFLETEIQVVARHFEEVVLVPTLRDGDHIRQLPDNVRLSTALVDRVPGNGRRIVLRHLRRFCSVYARSLFGSSSNAYPYLRHGRYYLGRLIGELEYRELIFELVQKNRWTDSVFYAYWFDHCLTALSVLKREGVVRWLVARAHGFDLYDDRNQGRPIAFRGYKMEWVDRVFCISQHGVDYLKSKVARTHHGKIRLSYLGVAADRSRSCPRIGAVPLIVSASSLIPYKRVELLARAMAHYQGSLRWVHFGSGPEHANVMAVCEGLPPNIDWELAGHVPNEAVRAFYEANYVNLFVSLSNSEGLPVSMMEAISFGIPIMACRVNGTPEIVVNSVTGLLLDVALNERAAAHHLQQALDLDFDREKIREFFLARFEAEKNYTSFCKALDF